MNRRRSFTLIETLAVLVLTVLLLTSVVQLLQQAAGTQRAARAISRRNGQADVLEHVLAGDLENLLTHAPIVRAVQSPGPSGGLLEIVCLAPADLTQPDQPARPWQPSRVQYVLQAMDQQAGLVLTRQQQDLTQPSGTIKPQVRPVASGLEQLQVTFWDGSQWQDRWPPAGQEAALPAAVRVAWKSLDGSTGQFTVDSQ